MAAHGQPHPVPCLALPSACPCLAWHAIAASFLKQGEGPKRGLGGSILSEYGERQCPQVWCVVCD